MSKILNLFNFVTRIGRRDYCIGLLSSTLVILAVGWLIGLLPQGQAITSVCNALYLVLALVNIIYWLCLMRQRANDIGWRPWIVTLLAIFVPLGVVIIGLVPGSPHDNPYGPARKHRTRAAE